MWTLLQRFSGLIARQRSRAATEGVVLPQPPAGLDAALFAASNFVPTTQSASAACIDDTHLAKLMRSLEIAGRDAETAVVGSSTVRRPKSALAGPAGAVGRFTDTAAMRARASASTIPLVAPAVTVATTTIPVEGSPNG